MKLVLFALKADAAGKLRVGVQLEDAIAPVTGDDGAGFESMRRFLELGDAGRALAERAVADKASHVANDAAVLKAPIYDPEKVLCIGMNYVDHCTEQGLPIPEEPVVFNKFASSIIAPGEPLVKPPETSEFDFEVELAIVIGKAARRVTADKAMEHVAGFTVAHDVSARDWQLKKNGKQWLLGKAMDGFCPLGPAIVTTDEIGDPHNLRLRTILNGVVVQDGSTRELVHKTEALIAWVSSFMTLKPGDLILTGTPPGVGCFRKPDPLWMKAGDVVTVEIEKIGSITNTVVDEVVPAGAATAAGRVGGAGTA